MVRRVGSWWIKDGIEGRRTEAVGFASLLGSLPQFDWTENHGDSAVAKGHFAVVGGVSRRSDDVDALQMSSHGSPNGFSVWGGSVTTSDTVDFGFGDLEYFATHACQLVRHDASHNVGRWIPAFERLHYMLGFHTNSYSGGQDARGQWFAIYAAWFHYALGGWWPDLPVREAWAEANEIVEGSNVQWGYLRAEAPNVPTYQARMRAAEPTDPVSGRSFRTARGTC